MTYEIALTYRSASCSLIVWEDEGTITISSLSSEFPRRGHGREIMKKAVGIADSMEYNMILRVLPYGDGPIMNDAQLREFYGKFGFKACSNNIMTRAPHTNKE